MVGKIHVGTKEVYPWTVFDDIETRDAAKYADHVDDFLEKAQRDDKAFHLVVGAPLTSTEVTRMLTCSFARHTSRYEPGRIRQ